MKRKTKVAPSKPKKTAPRAKKFKPCVRREPHDGTIPALQAVIDRIESTLADHNNMVAAHSLDSVTAIETFGAVARHMNDLAFYANGAQSAFEQTTLQRFIGVMREEFAVQLDRFLTKRNTEQVAGGEYDQAVQQDAHMPQVTE